MTNSTILKKNLDLAGEFFSFLSSHPEVTVGMPKRSKIIILSGSRPQVRYNTSVGKTICEKEKIPVYAAQKKGKKWVVNLFRECK